MTFSLSRVLLVLALILAPSLVMAQSQAECSPEAQQELLNRYKKLQQDEVKALEPLFRQIKKVREESTNLGSCVDLKWPSPSITMPSMDIIIRGIAQQLIQRACSEARSAVADATSPFGQSFYFNPGIPGVGQFGVDLDGGPKSAPIGTMSVPRATTTAPAAQAPSTGVWGSIEELFGGKPKK